MTISVILPVHNRLAFTKQFLASLQSQSINEPTHLVIVDDGSSDGTGEFLASLTDTTVIRGDGTLWWAGSVQRALAQITPNMSDDDFVYLANNDTVLDPDHLAQLHATAMQYPDALIGSVSFEVWPDGHRHPVSCAFVIDSEHLETTNLPGNTKELHEADALAGRGVLIPADAARRMRLDPQRRPQHFADLAMTANLKRKGFALLVQPAATSTQLERAGSSVEFQPRLRDIFKRRSQLYLPALWSFWWEMSSGWERITLPVRFIFRGLRQTGQGAYDIR
jgi:GT2 family glycosyltransferase